MIDRFESKVVGVTHCPDYPDNLYALEEAAGRAFVKGGEGVAAVLVRNPDNEFDENAIEVHVPALGDGAMIGHLPRDLAAKLAPVMDDGVVWGARVKSVYINPDHPDKPGIALVVERVSNTL